MSDRHWSIIRAVVFVDAQRAGVMDRPRMLYAVSLSIGMLGFLACLGIMRRREAMLASLPRAPTDSARSFKHRCTGVRFPIWPTAWNWYAAVFCDFRLLKAARSTRGCSSLSSSPGRTKFDADVPADVQEQRLAVPDRMACIGHEITADENYAALRGRCRLRQTGRPLRLHGQPRPPSTATSAQLDTRPASPRKMQSHDGSTCCARRADHPV